MTNSIIINNENTRDRTRKVLNSTNKTLVLISISKRIKEKKIIKLLHTQTQNKKMTQSKEPPNKHFLVSQEFNKLIDM